MNLCRIIAPGNDWPAGWPDCGPGWQRVDCAPQSLAPAADVALLPADSTLSPALLDRLALPILLHVAADAPALAHWLDLADGYVLPGDDPAELGAQAGALALLPPAGVADASDTAQHISALSAQAQRIADALAQLASQADAGPPVAVNAALVRRLLRLRRDRDRHFPAEIFADPAWDMLLDLCAARMEGIDVPVSSLCVAAAVPTTTALRWIRTLSQAGLLVRRTDPHDARRAFLSLSDPAHDGVQAWLRRFATAFQLR